ncbi:uncharacterized protein LOC113315685 [Papaver somniferum]|uniref:uncharacterized protein LOC113315685 n=1 Tax=Papaver somniferum TaxID=3469 RepID=UPI000E6FCEFB|nr:uncharacterized protein LOC113315685 [Papaver somniferum]
MGNMEIMMERMDAVIIPSYDEELEQVNILFPNQRPRYDPYSNAYNPGWKDHPNFSYVNKQVTSPNPYVQQGGFQQPRYQPQQQFQPQQVKEHDFSSDDKFNALMQGMQGLTSMLQKNQQKTDSAIKALEIKVGGKQVEQPNQQDEVHEELVEDKEETTPKETSKKPVPTFTIPPPFPSRFAKSKKELEYKDILDVLKKVQVNIPLIEATRQIPRYAKFLKELCMKKKRLKGNEVMSVGENASAFILKKLPPKLKDPGSFTIPCTIGKTRFTRALLDLGASVNVMPSSIYDSLNLGPLKETGVVLELSNRSNVYPKGIVENVLVKVNDLLFPADFYVFDMNDENSPKSTSLLLGILTMDPSQVGENPSQAASELITNSDVNGTPAPTNATIRKPKRKLTSEVWGGFY